MCMVWLFVPYAYTYYTITVYMKHIALASTVLPFMNYTHDVAFCHNVLQGLTLISLSFWGGQLTFGLL